MPDKPVILITGASSGIGAATARLFARSGYRVALFARRADRLEVLASEIQAFGGEALVLAGDLQNLSEIQGAVAAVLAEWGQIDVLFNNAGLGRLDWVERLDPQEEVAAQILVNLTGSIWMAQAVLPAMIARGKGQIIQMGSVASYIAPPTYAVYAASKFGVRGFIEALRREVRLYGIQVSGIYPGGVETEFAAKAGIRRRTGVRTPGWMRLSAGQVAEGVLSLARRPRRALILPWPMRLAIWLERLLPGLVDQVVERGFVRRERGSGRESTRQTPVQH
jgi:short-subunit dehydrogenase